MAIEDFYKQSVSRISISTGAWGTTATRTTQEAFLAAVNEEGKEAFVGDGVRVLYDAKFYCPATQTINHGDVLSINGADYHVLSVKDTFDKGHHKRVLLKRQ